MRSMPPNIYSKKAPNVLPDDVLVRNDAISEDLAREKAFLEDRG